MIAREKKTSDLKSEVTVDDQGWLDNGNMQRASRRPLRLSLIVANSVLSLMYSLIVCVSGLSYFRPRRLQVGVA